MFEGGYMGMDCAQPTACLNTLQYRLLLTHVVTKPEWYSVPNLPARPAICLTWEEDNVDICVPSYFSIELKTILRMFLCRGKDDVLLKESNLIWSWTGADYGTRSSLKEYGNVLGNQPPLRRSVLGNHPPPRSRVHSLARVRFLTWGPKGSQIPKSDYPSTCVSNAAREVDL